MLTVLEWKQLTDDTESFARISVVIRIFIDVRLEIVNAMLQLCTIGSVRLETNCRLELRAFLAVCPNTKFRVGWLLLWYRFHVADE